VPRGTLIIIGGARTPAAAFKEFVLAAGGARASIVVLPISMPAPLPAQDGMAEALKRAGVTDVTVLDQRTPQAIDQPEPLAALRRATGIWFGGGRQWRFVDAYEGTEAERQMHAVLARGGVIAGSSAGATIQGDYLVRGHPLGPQYMICEGYPRGMGFLPGVAIDQHFTQRKRQPDLIGFLGRYPQFLGIGLDESTAIIVRGSKAQVVGEHQVHFYDPRQGVVDASRCSSLSAGGEYDLLMRKVVTSPLETATTK
jgi:cyanophycinase